MNKKHFAQQGGILSPETGVKISFMGEIFF